MRIVLDTNIFISGIINPKSNAGKVIQEGQNNSFEVITSLELINEIKRVLKYPKITKIIKWDDAKIEEFIEYLHFFTTVIDISEVNYYFEQDPNDSHIIETYIAGKCDHLITGDKGLLSLKNQFNIIALEDFITNYMEL
jgi:uncharacterized protein